MDYQNIENANAGGYLSLSLSLSLCTFTPDNYLSQTTAAIKNSFIM